MEAGNIVLLPGIAFYFGQPETAAEFAALVLAALAAAAFLLVGALYWRGLHQRFSGAGRKALDTALMVGDRAEKPGLALVVLAFIIFGFALAQRGWSAAVIAAGLLSLLAALEYVNYYHRQLQHFDNLADFRRLIRGAGLKPSHMSRDLRRYRRR
jgi:Na+/proline symporter